MLSETRARGTPLAVWSARTIGYTRLVDVQTLSIYVNTCVRMCTVRGNEKKDGENVEVLLIIYVVYIEHKYVYNNVLLFYGSACKERAYMTITLSLIHI